MAMAKDVIQIMGMAAPEVDLENSCGDGVRKVPIGGRGREAERVGGGGASVGERESGV
jgi:hypothetical protein